jgi:NAD(P)-dependent dehydrogenase (short-subunit alcohol dehydrogenase family)
VLVNDVGCDLDGSGAAPDVASAVVDEIRAAGGTAAASAEPVGTAAAGEAIVRAAIDRFGRLDAIVNNAGISVSRPFAEFPTTGSACCGVHLTERLRAPAPHSPRCAPPATAAASSTSPPGRRRPGVSRTAACRGEGRRRESHLVIAAEGAP